MKITVNFGSLSVIVPCGDGKFTIRELTEKSFLKFKKLSLQYYGCYDNGWQCKGGRPTISPMNGHHHVSSHSDENGPEISSISSGISNRGEDGAGTPFGASSRPSSTLKIESLTALDGALFDLDDAVCDVMDDNDHVYAQLNNNNLHHRNHHSNIDLMEEEFNNNNNNNNNNSNIYLNPNTNPFYEDLRHNNNHHRGIKVPRNNEDRDHDDRPTKQATVAAAAAVLLNNGGCFFSETGSSSVSYEPSCNSSRKSSPPNKHMETPSPHPDLPAGDISKATSVTTNYLSDVNYNTEDHELYSRILKKTSNANEIPNADFLTVVQDENIDRGLFEIPKMSFDKYPSSMTDDGLIYSFPSFVSEIEITDDISESSALSNNGLQIRRNSDPYMDYKNTGETFSTSCSSTLRYRDLKLSEQRAHSEFTLYSEFSNIDKDRTVQLNKIHDENSHLDSFFTDKNLSLKERTKPTSHFEDLKRQMDFYENLLALCQSASQLQPSIFNAKSTDENNGYLKQTVLQHPDIEGFPNKNIRIIHIDGTNPDLNGGISLGIHVIPYKAPYISTPNLDDKGNAIRDDEIFNQNNLPQTSAITINTLHGLLVQKLESDGLVKAKGFDIKPGDLITQINGHYLRGKSFKDCLKIFKEAISSDSLTLNLVKYSPSSSKVMLGEILTSHPPYRLDNQDITNEDMISNNTTTTTLLVQQPPIEIPLNESLVTLEKGALSSFEDDFQNSLHSDSRINTTRTCSSIKTPADYHKNNSSISLHSFQIPLYRFILDPNENDLLPSPSQSNTNKKMAVATTTNLVKYVEGKQIEIYDSLGVSVKGKTAVIHTGPAPYRNKESFEKFEDRMSAVSEESACTVPAQRRADNTPLPPELKSTTVVRERDLGIFVKSVIPRGAAYYDARLSSEDQIIAINGDTLLGLDNVTAMHRLKAFMKHLLQEPEPHPPPSCRTNRCLEELASPILKCVEITVLRKKLSTSFTTAPPPPALNKTPTTTNVKTTIPNAQNNHSFVATTLPLTSERIVSDCTIKDHTNKKDEPWINSIKRASSLNVLLLNDRDKRNNHQHNHSNYQKSSENSKYKDSSHNNVPNPRGGFEGNSAIYSPLSLLSNPTTAVNTNKLPQISRLPVSEHSSSSFNLTSPPTPPNKFASKSPRSRRLRNKLCNESFRAALDLNFDITKYKVTSNDGDESCEQQTVYDFSSNPSTNSINPVSFEDTLQPLYSEIKRKIPQNRFHGSENSYKLLKDDVGTNDKDETLQIILEDDNNNSNGFICKEQLDESVYNSPIWFVTPNNASNRHQTSPNYQNLDSPTDRPKKFYPFTKIQKGTTDDHQPNTTKNYQSYPIKFSLKNIGGFVLKKIKPDQNQRKPRSSSTHRNLKIKEFQTISKTNATETTKCKSIDEGNNSVTLIRKISSSVKSFEYHQNNNHQRESSNQNSCKVNQTTTPSGAILLKTRQISNEFHSSPSPSNNIKLNGSLIPFNYSLAIDPFNNSNIKRPQSALYTDGPYLLNKDDRI